MVEMFLITLITFNEVGFDDLTSYDLISMILPDYWKNHFIKVENMLDFEVPLFSFLLILMLMFKI
jgi:hypothetical protein